MLYEYCWQLFPARRKLRTLFSYGFTSLNRKSVSSSKARTRAKDFALNHFDNFYGPTFNDWTSIRLALLCPHSYCAVVNSFSDFKQNSEFFYEMGALKINDIYDHDNCIGRLGDLHVRGTSEHQSFQKMSCESDNASNALLDEPDDEDFVPVTKLKDLNDVVEEPFDYSSYLSSIGDFKLAFSEEDPIKFSEYLDVYFFPRGKPKEFPSPIRDTSGLLNYYLMDGASILPVLALNIQKGDTVGDFCSSPGGKALAVIFGMKFGKIVCNDASPSRVKKLKTVLNSYLPFAQEWNKKILVSNVDVCSWHMFGTFDKILLDVPCTNDRLSVTREGNSIFKQTRFNERMMLPKTQTEMLCNALKALKPGGSLVYSTCTLSPMQNDGVVHMSLSKLCSDSSYEFVVKDLTKIFYALKEMFKFSKTCKYGQLVVPFLPLNYGPMYICKICRIK